MEPFRALVVEDARSMRKIIRQGLEKNFDRIEVDEAANGREALQNLARSRYALILSDLDMPVMDGEQLLLWVRSQPVHRNTPFIMITATREREAVTKILKAGANAYLIKPFTMDDLLQKIVHLNRRQHERYEVEGSAIVRFGDNAVKAKIIDVSKGGIFGLFARTGAIPTILEIVAVDLEPVRGASIKGLNAYVIRMQADGDSLDATHVKVAIRFNEVSAEKQAELERFFDSLKS